MKPEEIIILVNEIPACFAFANNGNIEVTYRGKRNDKVLIDVKNESVSFTGKAEPAAIKIAKLLNFNIL